MSVDSGGVGPLASSSSVVVQPTTFFCSLAPHNFHFSFYNKMAAALTLLAPSSGKASFPIDHIDLRTSTPGAATTATLLPPPTISTQTIAPTDFSGNKARRAYSPSSSLLDDHLVAQPLNLDLYNPMSSTPAAATSSFPLSSTNKLKSAQQRLESRSAAVNGDKTSHRVYRNYNPAKQSSTASLAEFLKTTGPEDLELRKKNSNNRSAPPMNPRPGSPIRKKNFLLKFAVGKSAAPGKRDDATDITSSLRHLEIPSSPPPPIAQQQFTAAGRKYFAIKVDYPYHDDNSISERPLLAVSPTDPRSDTRSEMDYHEIMARKKHHRLSSVLASDTSMEFLGEGEDDDEHAPRTSERYASYPPSRNRYSLVRSNSLSEITSPIESFIDDGSILPGDSVSLRPAQVYRTRANTESSTTMHSARPGHASKGSFGTSVIHSPSVVTTAQDERSLAASPIPLNRQSPQKPMSSQNTLELMASLEMLDELRKQKVGSEDGSVISQATARSIQQRRKARRLAQANSSIDVTKGSMSDGNVHPPRSVPDLNGKGLPMLPPHMNGNTDAIQKARAAAAAAKLSAKATRKAREQSPEPTSPAEPAPMPRAMPTPTTRHRSGSLEEYSIPEDDVLSLRSGVSDYRSQRREKVRSKRQRDLDRERSKKLDEAMRLLQEDVQKKRAAVDREEGKEETGSNGSETPRQKPSVERLRTPPITPPPFAGLQQFSLSPVRVVVDWAPSGVRRKRSSKSPRRSKRGSGNSENRPKTSQSQRTMFTNGPITPVSSTPSSPTRSQYDAIAKQPIPKMVSLPPSYPPPNPSPSQSQSSRATGKSPTLSDEEDREARIAALEEQKWVLEQALRVLLNQQGNTSPVTSPRLDSDRSL